MALSAFVLMGVLGLSVDLGRMFVAKNETQAFCDAAALQAALKLNGSSTGIAAATSAVAASRNYWNSDTQQLSSSNYTVDFATNAAGPWSTNPAAANITYVRVQSTVPVSLYFLPAIVNQFTQNVTARAIAAQIPVTSFTQGMAPFTGVASDKLSSDNYGLTVGNSYDIQWPAYNSTRNGCDNGHPDQCFIQNPCDGDMTKDRKVALQEVVNNWGASINGYWGSSANSTIYQEVLDLIQLNPVTLGQDITMVSGNKNSEARALDIRVMEDGDVTDNTVTDYLANSAHNGRRLIALPIVMPGGDGAGTTQVVGFGSFLLVSNSRSSTDSSSYYTSGNGNDPFCAIYAGPYVQGSTDPGAGSTGSYKVQLVF